jgi:hypothetical protein
MYFVISQLAPSNQCFLGRDKNFKNSYKGWKSSKSTIGLPLLNKLKIIANQTNVHLSSTT